MSNGLIWAGIGKGLADAGSTMGQFLLRGIEQQRQLEAEERREANYVKRLEEADRIKTESAERKAEELQQRVIKETTEAQTAGKDVAAGVIARQLKGVQGAVGGESPAMSEGELSEFVKANPQYRKTYEDAGYIAKQDQRMAEAEGAISSAMSAGAHSTTIKNLQDIRKATLDQIRLESAERKEERTEKEAALRHEETGKRLDIANRVATAAETRAGKEGTQRSQRETTMDLQRKVDIAKDALAESLGVKTSEVYAELKNLEKRAATNPKAKEQLESLGEVRKELADARSRLKAWEAKGGSEKPAPTPAAEKPAPAAAEKAPSISAVQGAPAGSSIGAKTDKGWEVKDKSGKLLGYVRGNK